MSAASLMFSSDYSTARRRFRAAASRLGWALEAHALSGNASTADELTVDVASSSQSEENNALFISGGLHGVEGFFGSALQLGLLERWADRPEEIAKLKVVLIHALNPFGFARLRRVDEHNVDLNRNFLLPGEPFSGSPQGYAGLDEFLNPNAPPNHREFFLPRALKAIAGIGGMAQFKQAVASGQYDFPKGLFYGGAKPSRTQQILAEHLPRWIGPCNRLVHLDLHTGLGKPASWKLLIDYPLTRAQQLRLESWFGAGHFEQADSKGLAYRTRGSLGQWCVGMNKQVDYLYACAEFGTCGALSVLKSLRAENQAHHWANAGDVSINRSKEKILEAFCPKSDQWRERALKEGYRLIDPAIAGLQALRAPLK